jgi:two-component system, NtrC family, response regulator HydG
VRCNDPPTVLVVDDRPEMAEVIAEGLCDRGYRALAITSAREALERLRTDRIDALVTDISMPEIGGLELLRASARLDPSRPVIVISAYSTIESAGTASDEGAYHYLPKPFRLDVLSRIVRQALELRSSEGS